MLESLRRSAFFGLVWGLVVFGGSPLEAQNAGIVYAEGGDFSVIRQLEEESFNASLDNVLGLPLEAGDLVQTGNDTFLEIEMADAGAIFKVAENTSFRLEYAGDDGSSRLDLAYGRVRAKVEDVAAGTFLEMRGLSVVAGVRGTDFGYDIIVTSSGSGEPVLQIYTFEGSVVVAEGDSAATAGSSLISASAPQTTIQSGQMIALPLSTVLAGNIGEALAQPPSTITPEVREFWDAHPFQSAPGEVPQVAEVAPGAVVSPPPILSSDEGPLRVEPLEPVPPFVFAPPAMAMAEVIEIPDEEIAEEAPTDPESEEADEDGPTGEGWKRAGVGMAVIGSAVALTGVAMYFALDMVDVPAGYEPAVSPGIAMMIGGGGLVVGGLGAYITGAVIGGR
ncbi:MAG: FecR domain-containing protein [Spirochaetaceae bacterium]